MADQLQIPPDWNELPINDWHLPILLLGWIDTGKSTLGRYIYDRLSAGGRSVAYLDLDPGQNDLAPPSTLALGSSLAPGGSFPPDGKHWLYFVGSNTPRFHLLRILSGTARLFRQFQQISDRSLVVNTSGFITRQQGGEAIKWAKIDLLRPCIILALQRANELESLLTPLSHLPGISIYRLPVTAAVQRRNQSQRQQLRAGRYRSYFRTARTVSLSYKNLAIFPGPRITPGQLIALEEESGLTVALGIVEEQKQGTQLLYLRTPWQPEHSITTIRAGDLTLHPQTFQDTHLNRRN